MNTSALEGGFDVAPYRSADGFRAAMTAMARPGCIETVTGGYGPSPMSQAAAVLILTLCDAETPVFLARSHNTKAVRDWITFHTNAPLVTSDAAMFALGTWDDLNGESNFSVGTSQYPDRSVTLIVETTTLVSERFELRGPGIEDVALMNVPDAEFCRNNNAKFPLGVDQFLTCGSRLAALPRTTKVSPCM